MATPPDSPVEDAVYDIEPCRLPKAPLVALEDLCRQTKFTRQEIRVMYRGFKQVTVTPSAEGFGFQEPLPNFGSPPSLVEICLKLYADNFSTSWKFIKHIPASNLKKLGQFIDLNNLDVGMAARALYEDSFWKRWTYHKWSGYHKPWAHKRNWKVYFLQKYLAECLTGQDPDNCKTRDLRRLARRVKHWIYSLEIKQLSSPPWPAAVDVDSSTDTAEDSQSECDIKSDTTLSQYLNRHINFFPMPASTVRLELQPVFELLTNLTHLTFSFGFDNFNIHKDVRFSKVADEDAFNLAQALAASNALYCFKLTRSIVTPKQLETIIFGLNDLEFFRELEFSHLFLNDGHMVSVTGLLLLKRDLRSLSLKNNRIGSEGFIRLLHAVVLKDCKLKIFDVSMNPIGDAGGVALAALLAKKNMHLKRIFMSGTGLTHVSGYNFGVVLYFNKCLEVLDLSVNAFSDFAAEALLKGVEHNYTLKRIDLRECGIPFTTVREIERICVKNANTVWREQYKYPVVHPADFWSGFNELDEELPENLKPEKTDQELADEEEEVTQELMQIFVWATAQMKPRQRCILVRDIHALMKKTSFVTGFGAVADKLILSRQKELIQKSRLDAKREKEERTDGSTMMIDFSFQEFMKKTGEKLKADFLELEALQVLNDVNRCGRIDQLLKSVKSDRIDVILKRIGRAVEVDSEILSPVGISLPFAKKWYKNFPDPNEPQEEDQPDEEVDEEFCEEEEEKEGEHEDEREELVSSHSVSDKGKVGSLLNMKSSRVDTSMNYGSDVKGISQRKPSGSLGVLPSLDSKSGVLTSLPALTGVENQKKLPRSSVASVSARKSNPMMIPSMALSADRAFQEVRDRVLGLRAKFRKWPKEAPPVFPKVIPYELIEDCNDNLPDTESEQEDDFPYWLDQWFQKY